MKNNKLLLPALVLALLFAANAMAPSAPPEGKAAPPWELARNKVDAARRTCLAVAQEYLEGKATVEQVHQWSQRWMRADQQANNKKAEQLEALKGHVSRMQELEKKAQDRLQNRRGLASDVPAAEYHRLEAELDLSRARSSR
jgi:hypothetical protein